jgi:methionine synthase I (cobalamin-dependent)
MTMDIKRTIKNYDLVLTEASIIEALRRYDVRILGGCCGTSSEHMQYIIQNLNSEQVAGEGRP